MLADIRESNKKKIKENEVFLQDLITDSSYQVGIKETKQILKGLYDFRTLPKEYAEFPTDILIWDDHVALVTLEDPIFGSVITNELLAKTFTYLFKMIWQGQRKDTG